MDEAPICVHLSVFPPSPFWRTVFRLRNLAAEKGVSPSQLAIAWVPAKGTNRGLDNLQEVEASFQGHRFFLRSQLVAHAYKAIRASGTAVPPTIREA